MSRVKKKASGKKKFDTDVVSNNVVDKYGDVVSTGTEVLETINSLQTIGVSPALDIALGGGLREGSVVVMTGDPKSGKTTTALHFAAKCQAQNKRVIYLNTEGRLSKQNFEGIKGLDPERILIIQSTDDKILSAEEFLNITEYYINNDPGCLIIADSLSNMVPSVELDGEVRTGVRNALPRLLSMFFKRISGSLMKNKVILIAVTHNIANTGGSPYAPSKMADCGNMLQYQAGTNMVITHRGRWQVPKDSGPHVGQIANWNIKTSCAGGVPGSTAEGWIRYGIGVDEIQEVVQIACEFRLIKTAGAWYTIQCAIDNTDHPVISKLLSDKEVGDKEEDIERFFKFQGSNNTLEFLNENPELSDFIYEQIKELF
jgi:recombination protein RecA